MLFAETGLYDAIIQVVGLILTAVTTIFGGIMAYKLAVLSKQSAAAAVLVAEVAQKQDKAVILVAEVAEKQDVAVEAVLHVKTTLATETKSLDRKIDGLSDQVAVVHKATNGLVETARLIGEAKGRADAIAAIGQPGP